MALAALSLLASSLAACSKTTQAGSGSSPSPKGPSQAQLVALVSQAGPKTEAAGNAVITVTSTTTTGSKVSTLAESGSLDFAGPSLSVQATLPSIGTMSLVYTGGVFYMKSPVFAAVSQGKPWLKFDLNALASIPNAPPSITALVQLFKNLPGGATSQLSVGAGVSGTVTVVGTEVVGGTPTTHYAYESDLQHPDPNLPAGTQAALKALATTIGLTSAHVDAWLDGNGVIRQEEVKGSATPPGGSVAGIPAGTVITTDALESLSSFGAAPPIVTPPPGQTQDFGALLQQDGGLSSG